MKYAAIASILVFLSCAKKDPLPAANPGYEYYPAGTGRFVIYEVDSTVYREIPRDTTVTRYQVKEIFADTFTDNEGRTARRLERYYRMYDPVIPYEDKPWILKEVWMATTRLESVQVQEGNQRYTKLAFPAFATTKWNGTPFQEEEQVYQYEYVGVEETLNGNAVKTLKVKQRDFRTLISLEMRHEKYAEGIGLIEKAITAVYSNSVAPGIPVEQRIENGMIYKQTLVSYGRE